MPSSPAHFTRKTSVRWIAAAAALLAVQAGAASFKFGQQTLTVPDGFTVELVAGPPLVNRPISIAFEESGRLYATDSSGLSERAQKQLEEKPHRVMRLEDSDGDGRFDRATEFAGHMMFPQGAMFHDGSLFVAAPPHIWKLTDADGDGVAEKREIWWDGKTLTGCANDVHGPQLGTDGWFYWTKGAFAEQRHTLGDGREFVTRAAHIFRSRPDGSGFEPVLTGGMDNPVGVSFTSAGERFLVGTFFQIPAAGRRDGIIHSLYGGVYGKENAASDGHPRTGDLMPIMTHMGAAAPSATTIYRSNFFGPDFTDNLFVCYFNLRKVSRHELGPDGATFRTRDSDFVTSDHPDFRPTDVLEDADGSLLVVDTGGWYKICCPTSQLAKPDVLGGIYRVRRAGAPRPDDPRGLKLAWNSLDTAGLARLLGDPRTEVRERAMFHLGQAGAKAVPALRDLLTSAKAKEARAAAVWTLARISAPEARAAARASLGDSDPDVVRAALNVAGLWRDQAASASILPLLASPDAGIARLAAEAIGRSRVKEAVSALLAATARLPRGGSVSANGSPEDPVVRASEHALIHAMIEIASAEPLLESLRIDGEPRRVRAALVALDQIAAPDLDAAKVLPFLASPEPLVQRTAGWIASRRPDWGGALAGFFGERLRHPPAAPDEIARLEGQLRDLARSPAIQVVLTQVVEGGGASSVLALRVMASAGLKETPSAWLSALSTALAAESSPVRQQAVATARALSLPKAMPSPLTSALNRIGRAATERAATRLEALSLAARVSAPLEPDLFAFLSRSVLPDQPLRDRANASETLARAALSREQLLELATVVQAVGALELPRILAAFDRNADDMVARRLLASIASAAGRSAFRADTARSTFARNSPEVKREAAALVATLHNEAARQNARVDEVAAGLSRGDIRRGQELFNSPKAACILCHKIGYGGGLLGPDLTSIGRIRDPRELLESIMYPSATLVRGYEPVTVNLRGGGSHSGIVRKDAPDEMILATGPDSEVRIGREDIAGLSPGEFSLMPPGMDVIMSPAELADLVAFLKSRN